MGSMGYWQKVGREDLLKSLFNGDYECVVRLVGKDRELIGTDKEAVGAYKLFQKFDEEEIREYAKTTSFETNMKVSKIEILTLKPLVTKEILIEDSENK